MLANSEYLARHNRALMVMAVAWAKEQNLLNQNVKWYQENWKRWYRLENSQAKLIWDFEFNLRKTATSRGPDLMLEEKQTKTMDMWYGIPAEENIIEKKRLEKRTHYRQLPFELRERRPEFKVVPLVISAFGAGLKEILKELEIMFEKGDLCERIVAEMQKTILMDSEIIIRKQLSGLDKWLNKFMIITDNNKLLDGLSIWLHDLNRK